MTQCQINTLQDLANCLSNEIKSEGGSQLTLSNALFPEAGNLVGYLQLTNLVITGAKMPSSTGSVVVTGSATILSAATTVTLTGWVDSGAVTLQLSGVVGSSANWTFKTSFPNLPQYTGVSGSFLAQLDSFFYQLSVSAPTFIIASGTNQAHSTTQGITFTGTLDITKAPVNVVSPLTSATSLPLGGSIVLGGGGQPTINLQAPIAGLSISLGKVSIGGVYISLQVLTDPETKTYESTISLAGIVQIGTGTDPVTISSPLLQGDFIWSLDAEFTPGQFSLTNGLNELTSFINGSPSDFVAPAAILKFTDFSLNSVGVGVDPATLDIKYIAVEVASGPGDSWNTPVPKMKITSISTGWLFLNPLDSATRSISGYVRGVLQFGDTNPVDLSISAAVPNFLVEARLEEGSISVRDTLTYLFGSAGNVPDLVITQLMISLDPTNQMYTFYAIVEDDDQWPINLGITTLQLVSLTVDVNYSPTGLAGSISALLLIGGKRFVISAEHPGANEGWIFTGMLMRAPQNTIKVTEAIAQLWGGSITLPSAIPDIEITELDVTVGTADSSFELGGKIEFDPNDPHHWQLTFAPDFVVDIDAFTFDVKSAISSKTGQRENSGFIKLEFSINDVAMSVEFDFKPANDELIIKMGKITATLTFGPNIDTVLTLNLGDMSFGDILTWLVNLARPGHDFKLDAPWDVLNSLSLKGLELTVNITQRTVGIVYELKKDFGFIDIESIGLSYVKKDGKGTVEISFVGSFLGQQYGQANPLKWDALNDPPPSVPGKGSSLFDLKYLGVGQHVAFSNPGELSSVEDVIKKMIATVIPATDPSKNPMTQLQGLTFDPGSNWLMGAQFTVIDTLDLSLVFNDPVVYGLLIKLSGDKAKIFAGLSFEILYKKVSDNLGLYHIVLVVPEIMRHLEFGEVSITLPRIILDIYTNGNFKVDFGFPANGDFTYSFGIQAFIGPVPVLGAGGFYFALLSSATSTRVPKITNGDFNPVIEFGFGLQLGLGKTIDEGILKAGISVVLQGILQGALGFFNPSNPGTPSDHYYWLQGSVAIVGKLYATIDFAIIKASLDVTITAGIQLTIEAYQPIEIYIYAGVSVTLSIKIVFFTIHLSFHATVHATFTIGSVGNPPWQVASGGESLAAPRPKLGLVRPDDLRTRPIRPAGFRGLSGAFRMQANLFLAAADNGPDWSAFPVWTSPQTVPLTFTPSFTIGLPINDPNTGAFLRSAAVEAAGVPTTPQPMGVALLFIKNSIPQGANGAGDYGPLPPGTSPSPFDLVIQAMLGWVIRAYASTGEDTAGLSSQETPFSPTIAGMSVSLLELELIYQQLSTLMDAGQSPFTASNLSDFFAANLNFNIAGRSTDTNAQPVNATVFPMPPVLSLQTSDMSKPLDFSSYKECGLSYQQIVNIYLQQLMVAFENSQGQQGVEAEAFQESGQESLVAFIFQDYFGIVAKAAVQDAISFLTQYSYVTAGGDSLGFIAQKFSAHGEGSVLTVGDIMQANQSTKGLFATNAKLRLSGVRYSVVKGDTLQSIANKFTGGDYSQIVTLNQDLVGLIQKGAQFNITGLQYTVPAQSTLSSLAAMFQVPAANVVIGNSTGNEPTLLPDFTRLSILNTRYTVVGGDTLAGLATKFNTTADLITALNSTLDLTKGLTSGTVLKIPTVKYTVVAGDTLGSLAYRFSVTPSSIETLNTGVDFSSLAPGTVLNMPDLDLVLPPSTDIGVAKYFGVTMDALAAANMGVNFSKTIPPNTALNIANTRYTVIPGDTPQSIASKFNTTAALITTLNPGVNMGVALVPGTLLVIPLITYATVANDTASIIATRFAITTTLLEALNTQVNFNNPLTTGTVLNMPDLVYTVPQDTSGGFPVTDTAIAHYFHVTLQGLIDANTLVDFSQVLPPNTKLNIPAVAYTAGASDTLSSIGYYYGISAQTLAQQISGLTVLEPVATVALPDFDYAIQTNDTFGSIASSNNLTITDLAEVTANQNSPTLLASAQTLTLPNVPGIAVSDLLDGLYLSGKTQNIAGMVSRFLLSGLRLPDPDDPAIQQPVDKINWATLDTYPLYALNGQQFTVSLPAKTSYAISLELTTPTPWVTFATMADDASVTAVLKGNSVPTLTLNLLQSEADFINAVAVTPFTPQVTTSGKRPLFNETPAQSTLQHSVLWQAASAPALWTNGNAPASAQPTMWPFPPTLLQSLSTAESYGLRLTPQVGTQSQPGVSGLDVSPVDMYSWATAIDLTVSQVSGSNGSGPLSNTYIVGGTDDAGRSLLQHLWIALNTGTPTVTPTLYLLYQANPAGNNPNGVQSDEVDPAQVLLLKTNLSTLSHSSQMMLAEEVEATTADTVYSAALSDAKDFVKLVWECSVVNSGGYYLQYSNATGGAGLPGYLFSQTGSTTLTLLVTYAAVDTANSTLYPFQNSVVIGDNINTSNSLLFTEAVTYAVVGDESLGTIAGDYGLNAGQLAAANSTDVDLLRVGATMIVAGANYTIAPYDSFAGISVAHNNYPVASLGNDNTNTPGMLRKGALVDLNAGMVVKTASAPPGNVGLQLVRTDPTVGIDPNNEPVSVKLQVLYNLFGYEIVANTFFNESAEGLPVGPTTSDATTPRALAAAPAPGTWNYDRVVPVYPFATTNDISGTGNVPPASGNPYAGIVAGALVQLHIDFNDIFGNQMPPTPPLNDPKIGVGYYDNIIGVSQWPAVAASYSFAAVDSSTANLNVLLRFDVSRYMPGPGTALSTSVAKAQADLQTYTNIYYQIQQTDLQFTASTSVNQSAVETLDKAAIEAYVNAIYAYLLAAQSLQAYTHAVIATDTIGGLTGTYNVTVQDFVSLNDDISSFFAAPLSVNVPVYHRVAFGDTLDSIATASTVPLATLVQNNQDAPSLVAAGAAVTIGSQQYTASSTDTLAGILAQFTSSTTADVGDLANANAPVVLAPNVTFTYQGATYQTQGTDSFNTVVTHFPGATIPQIAAANAQIPLFNNNTPLSIPIVYAAKTGDTLASIAAAYKMTALQVATANADSTTLLQQGAGVFLSNEPMTIQATDSLQVIAANGSTLTSYPLTTAEIAQQNLDHNLNPSMTTPTGVAGELTIPDLVTLAPNMPSSYQVGGPDTLISIANSKGLQVTDLGEANKDLYGMFLPQKTVTVNGLSASTTATDTLNTLLGKINAQLDTADWHTLADLTLAIQGQTPLLATNAWILLPPPLLTISTPIALNAHTYPALTIFEVTAQLGMARSLPSLIDKDFQDVPAVASVSTVLSPNTYDPNNPDASLTLKSFATAFESAFAGLHLATAHEKDQSAGASTTTPPKLWAVNLGSTGTQFSIKGAAPYFFSVPPLSNTLMGEANVPLKAYKDGQLVASDPRSFESVDIDVWGRDFLAAIDSFLLPESVAPAYQLVPGEGQQGLTGAQAYDVVLAAKQSLAEAIQGGVTNILKPTSGSVPAGNLTAAQEALGQQLLITLGSAYSVDAIVQFDVAVTSPYEDAAAARFSGQPTASAIAPVVDYTLSSAQVPLANGTSYLTFLFSTKAPSVDKNVIFTNPTYQINELEFDIAPVEGIDGYVASSWLTFINPLASTPIPATMPGLVVPVPLRAYPIPPTLVSQEAVYTPDAQVKDIEIWEYDFTYQSLDAAQDTVGTSVTYNVPPTSPSALLRVGNGLDPQAPTNLFEALAQFSAAYPAVAADLALLQRVATQPDLAGRALSAVQAFASLVQVVPQFWAYPAPVTEEVYDHRYTINRVVEEDGTLSLTVRHAGGKSPEPAPMPHLVMRGYDLLAAPLAAPLASDGESASGNGARLQWTHRFARTPRLLVSGDPPPPTNQTTVQFPNNNILQNQTAQGSVWVTRNSDLITNATTNPVFVYQTPPVSFANPLLPLLINPDPYQISEINADGTMSGQPQQRTLLEHMTALFSALFLNAPNPPVIKVVCRYSYDLVTAGGATTTAIPVSVPVFMLANYTLQQSDLVPPATCDCANPSGFLCNLTCTIQNWQSLNQPAGSSGAYQFEIDIFSSIAPSATQPMLQITDLELSLGDILPPTT